MFRRLRCQFWGHSWWHCIRWRHCLQKLCSWLVGIWNIFLYVHICGPLLLLQQSTPGVQSIALSIELD